MSVGVLPSSLPGEAPGKLSGTRWIISQRVAPPEYLAAIPVHSHQSFYDADVRVTRNVSEVAHVEAVDGSEVAINSCGPARGILLGFILCAPFWIGLYVMLF